MSAATKNETQKQSQVQFTAFGSPDVLEVHETGLPEPGPGEVRVRVEASSVQFTDTLIRRRLYPDLRGKPPFTTGYDLVGVVDAVGAGVELAVGDRVADLCMVGGNARFAICPADRVVGVPKDLDAAEAVTLVLSWMTAQQAVFRVGGLQQGERLLVIGGNGSVGLAAIRLAVARGAEVYATASDKHHIRLRALGAHPLPREGWQEAVAELGGVDVVLDGVCADGFSSPFRALRGGGRLVGIGASASASGSASKLTAMLGFVGLPFRNLWPGKSAKFYSITSLQKKRPDWFRDDLTTLFEALRRGEIHPDVRERIDFEGVADAHTRLEAGGLTGKIVLIP